MNHENPYSSSSQSAEEFTDSRVHLLAKRLAAYHKRSPTLGSMASRWWGLPVFGLLGVVGVGICAMLASETELVVLQHSPTFVGALCLGALLRELKYIRYFVRIWPAWEQLIDWEQVDKYAE